MFQKAEFRSEFRKNRNLSKKKLTFLQQFFLRNKSPKIFCYEKNKQTLSIQCKNLCIAMLIFLEYCCYCTNTNSIYYYIFVCNKKTNEIKLIHQLNTPKIKLVAIKQTISTFKMTKGIFGQYEMSKKELDSLNIALVFYKNKQGNDGFANYQRKPESFSAGDMTELKVTKTEKTNKSPEKTTYTFVWDYFNSYDNETGKAGVVLTTSCENELRTTFVCKVYVRSKKEYLYFEGYLE